MSEEISEEKLSDISIELGDIIEIIAPSNDELHQSTFLITYIDESKMKLVNVATLEKVQLNVDGALTDESIQEIHLLSRSEEPGYARQNNLLAGTWIEVHFGGEISTILTGEISSLEEDQIEITTVPDLKKIYIDFGYKGIPEYLPITQIKIREKPQSLKDIDIIEERESPYRSSNEPSVDISDEGEIIINADEDAEQEENILHVLQNLVTKSKGLIIEDDIEEVVQYVELSDSQKRFGIDIQLNSILDEILSTIPKVNRSPQIMNKIHILIERYKELREMFSVFDENGNVRKYKIYDENLHKPVIDNLTKMDRNLKWIMPVSSIRKKIYTIGEETPEDNDFSDISIQSFDAALQFEEQVKSDTYYNNASDNGQIKLYNMYKQLTDLMTPFENPIEDPTIQTAIAVRTNIESIVDNLDDFYSTISKTGSLLKRRFVLQKYQLGMNKLEQRHDEIVRTQFTQSDKISIKSFITLPMPIVQYSRIDLPGTMLIDRVHYHQSYFTIFRLLKKNVHVLPYVIKDLTKELDYEQIEEETKQQFLSQITEYSLDPSLLQRESPENFDKFLQTIIPKTQILIRLLRKYIKYKLSFVSVVQQLEPFSIYSSDITFKQYSEIRKFISQQIEQLKGELDEKRKQFSFLTNASFDTDIKLTHMIRILKEDTNLMENFIVGYKFPELEILQKSYSSHEILEKIITFDQGVLFSKLLSSMMSPLMTPDSLLMEPTIDDMTDSQKGINDNCQRRVITKKYSSVSDLQKDNEKDEIFYDKEYDFTPYHILEKYKKEQKDKLAEDFTGFLAENLVQKHDCPRDRSVELAKQLIEGKKIVKNGEYAILEIRPKLMVDESTLSEKEKEELEKESEIRSKKQFYIRKKGHWIHEPNMNEEEFIPTEDILCQMDAKCYYPNERNKIGDSCESTDAAAIRMREIAKKRAVSEFDRRYDKSFEDSKVNLEDMIVQQIRYIYRLSRLNQVKSEKANNYSYELGLLANNTEETITSPYLHLRDLIIGQNDFKKKQYDIMRFYHQFCREPLEQTDKNMYWKYCKETNAPLLPSFLYELAECFISGGNYEYKLAEISHSYGVKSDSGDAHVDKHSGMVICPIAFSDEEGFNSIGLKISTHAFLEKDQSEKVLETLLSKVSTSDQSNTRICESEEAQQICNILEGIQRNLAINIDTMKDFIVRIAFAISKKTIKPEIEYNKFAQEIREKKGIKVLSYEKRREQLLIFITTASLFIAIQTAIPSVFTNKTMPGCVRSFAGYPLTGEEDTTGLKYMACVIDKMKSGWDSIKKMNMTIIYDELKKLIDTSILKHPEVDEKYLLKREYLEQTPDQEIPEEHTLEKWTNFYPPLFDTTCIKSLHTIASGFKDEYIALMRKGNHEQQTDFLVLKTKIEQYSYAIIEAIQKIVKTKEGVLRTITNNKHFLQNTCCNEIDKPYQPILYFIEEDDTIRQYMKIVRTLGKLVNYSVEIGKPAILYDKSKSGLKYTMIDSLSKTAVFEENIYAAFIHYCGLDDNKQIPTLFHNFFTEVPTGWNKNWSLIEKMGFLKSLDKRFSKEQLDVLMKQIANKNRIELHKTKKYNAVEMMKNMIEYFDNNDSSIMEGPLRKHLLAVLEIHDANKLITFLSDSDGKVGDNRIEKAKVLKDYLNRVNEKILKPEIIAFLKSHGKLEKRAFDKVSNFIHTIVKKWNFENQLSSISTFIKNAIENITVIFPNMIVNNIQNNRIHKYWGLSENDERALYNFNRQYHQPLQMFSGDRILHRLFQTIESKFTDLRLFFNTLPLYSPIKKDGREYFAIFDKDMIFFLLEYVFLSILHEYIHASQSDELLLVDRIETKMERRAALKEKDDISIQFASDLEEVDESTEDFYNNLSEIQIEMGNKEELKERVASLIITFLKITEDNKDDIDISYEMIAASIRKKKDAEKNRITEKLKLISIDERKIEDQKKKYKMDEWNVGMQKGLFIYDKATSDRERREHELEEQLEIAKYGIRSVDFDVIYNAESDEQPLADRNLDEEEDDDLEEIDALENQDGGIDISQLRSNWNDGGYYSEDGSDDEFGDNEY
jgi:hypothetical protein